MNTYGQFKSLELFFILAQLIQVQLLAFFFISMAVMMLIFMICATRTNVVYTVLFLTLLIVFLLLSSAHWLLAEGNSVAGIKYVKVSTPVYTLKPLM